MQVFMTLLIVGGIAYFAFSSSKKQNNQNFSTQKKSNSCGQKTARPPARDLSSYDGIIIYGKCPHNFPQTAIVRILESMGHKVLSDGSKSQSPQNVLVVKGEMGNPHQKSQDPRSSSFAIDSNADVICRETLYEWLKIRTPAELRIALKKANQNEP